MFILAENRLNLEQVFAELEALYMQPQAELHEAEWMGGPLVIPGAEETFKDAGLIVLSNKKVPQGKEIEQPQVMFDGMAEGAAPPMRAGATMTTAAAATTTITAGGAGPKANSTGDLAEVQRVRQFFPETWIWDETLTDDGGPRDPGRAGSRLHHHLGPARRRSLPRQRPGHRRELSPRVPAFLPAGRPALLVHPR